MTPKKEGPLRAALNQQSNISTKIEMTKDSITMNTKNQTTITAAQKLQSLDWANLTEADREWLEKEAIPLFDDADSVLGIDVSVIAEMLLGNGVAAFGEFGNPTVDEARDTIARFIGDVQREGE